MYPRDPNNKVGTIINVLVTLATNRYNFTNCNGNELSLSSLHVSIHFQQSQRPTRLSGGLAVLLDASSELFSNLNGEKLLTHGTRDVNCSNRFCFCFEKLNHGVSPELLEPSEKK